MKKAELFEKFIDSLELPNFRGVEFTPYWSKVSKGQKNSVPPDVLWMNIVPTLVVLQRLRTELGQSIILTSTYRSPAYNMAINGAGASFHMSFKAIDFHCVAGSPEEWADLLRSYRGKKFELPGIHGQFSFKGGIGVYSDQHFVHVDTRGFNADW